MAWSSRAAWFVVAAVSLPGCGDDGESTTATGTSSTGPVDPTTSGVDSTSSGPGSSETTGPAAPMLEPGGCGPSGAGFACGWAPAELCAPGTAVGEPCDGDPPCCLDAMTVMTCECIDNACEDQWYALDCTHGPGAGACGWDAVGAAYVCGGAAEDPGGSPMECPAVLDQGCDAFAVGTSCCDPDGNAVVCTDVGTNGASKYWAVTDCVLDP